LKAIGLSELDLSSGNEFVDGQTDGQTDKVITIGHPHLSMRGPIYSALCNLW